MHEIAARISAAVACEESARAFGSSTLGESRDERWLRYQLVDDLCYEHRSKRPVVTAGMRVRT